MFIVKQSLFNRSSQEHKLSRVRKKMTLKTIARELGVTHTTVSNAFSNPSRLSGDLRKRILDYAQNVGYYGPDPAARSLRTGKFGAIGVIFNDRLSYVFSDPHDIAFMRGIASVCERSGTNLVLIPLQHEGSEHNRRLEAMVDGYVLNATFKNNPITQRVLGKDVPIVTVDFESDGCTSVLPDNRAIMRKLTDYLLSLGHSNFGIVTFPLVEQRSGTFQLGTDIASDNYVASERLGGCADALIAAGLDPSGVWVAETPHDETCAMQACDKLLRKNPRMTAIICLSDVLALGVMKACATLGLSVPDRMSVSGFDDIPQASSSGLYPTLTTVRQNTALKGKLAAEALIFSNQEPTIEIETMLVIRSSTASPKT